MEEYDDENEATLVAAFTSAAADVDELLSDIERLNIDQRTAYDRIIKDGVADNVFFIDGPAGTGKTFLLSCLYRYVTKVKRKKILCTAFTGIAATLLPNGVTIHSAFGVPVTSDYLPIEQTQKIMRKKWKGEILERIKSVDYIIFDECSMIPLIVNEAIDAELRMLTGLQTMPYGGKTVVFSGDFRQLLAFPVGREKNGPQTIQQSRVWSKVVRLQLTTNMRALGDIEYAQYLLNIGNGLIGTTDQGWTIPEDMRTTELVSFVYFDDQKQSFVYDGGNNVILTGTNAESDAFNACVLKRLTTPLQTLTADDSLWTVDFMEFTRYADVLPAADALSACKMVKQLGAPDNTTNKTTKVLKFLKHIHADTPQASIDVKEGSVIVLTKNVDVDQRLCNGTRLVVQRVRANELICTRLGSPSLVTVTLSQFRTTHQLTSYDKRSSPLPLPDFDEKTGRALIYFLVRKQFPIRLAFAMTITKSQGQTFDKVGLYLPRFNSIFTHGHLYTALSRSSKREFVKIYSHTNKVRNIYDRKYLLTE